MFVGGGKLVVEIAACVITAFVSTMEMAVSITPVGFVVGRVRAGVEVKLLQAVKNTANNNRMIGLPMIFIFSCPFIFGRSAQCCVSLLFVPGSILRKERITLFAVQRTVPIFC